MSLTECLTVVSENIAVRAALPAWLWGNALARERLESSGLAGLGWLGKRIQKVSIAYEELRVRNTSTRT
jgi:hypothetical protein